jgi:hypothetical protein
MKGMRTFDCRGCGGTPTTNDGREPFVLVLTSFDPGTPRLDLTLCLDCARVVRRALNQPPIPPLEDPPRGLLARLTGSGAT